MGCRNPEHRKAYLREYQREWMAKRRAEFFYGKCCVECGSTENLELDHIDPKQKVTHKVWSWTKEKRDAETAKCQVLCHECHWKKTKRDMGYGLTHGTEHGYRYYRCQCDQCRMAHRDHLRKYRAQVRAKTEQEQFAHAA